MGALPTLRRCRCVGSAVREHAGVGYLVADRAGEERLWDTGFQFGDWLDPSAPPDKPGAARTDPHVVATAYFAHSAQLLGQVAGVLGRAVEEARYLRLAAQVRDAFDAEY